MSIDLLQLLANESAVRRLLTTGSKIGDESVKLGELSDDIVEADLNPLKDFFNTNTWVLIQQAGDVCMCVCVVHSTYLNCSETEEG